MLSLLHFLSASCVRLLPFSLLLCLTALLGACLTQQDDAPIIRFGISTAPVTLDPLQATDAVSGRINRLLYQRMVEFGSDHKPVPGITRWEQITAQHYRFKLIKNPRFHHNKALTAYDIKATYEAVLDKTTASPHRNSVKHIDRIEVLDKRTIDFYLSRPDPLFPAFLVIGIVPQDLLKGGHSFNNKPLGSGEFEFSH